MASETLQLIRDSVDGKLVLRAPSVGSLTAVPKKGRLLKSGDTAGVLVTLGVTRTLIVPPKVTGRVESKAPERVHHPISFGDILLELSPLGQGDGEESQEEDKSSTSGPVLHAPYSGRFWHRPAPGDPSFVSIGDRIEAGATVGLLEVMKTFTHLTYPSDGSLPSPAKVVAILVEDGGEIGEGDPVIEVEPT